MFSQSPNKISYQSVIRNSSNTLVANTPVGMRISIMQGSANGVAVYIETHAPTTNANGLASLEIGSGTIVSGTFSAINWANGPYFIKTETDPVGGINYTIAGTSQLMSVPYALYAATSGNSTPGQQGLPGVNGQNTLVKTTTESAGINCAIGGTKIEYGLDANNNGILDVSEINASLTKYICNGATGPQGPQGPIGPSGGFTHYIGEQFGGGVIFHLWKDASNVEHGLIVATIDQSTGQKWSNLSTTLVGASAQSSWNGLSNSNAIIGQSGHTVSAASICLDLVIGGQSDWYLPSVDELSLLWHNRFNVNKTLSMIGAVLPTPAIYWSSTESTGMYGWCFESANGSVVQYTDKSAMFYVRAIRAF